MDGHRVNLAAAWRDLKRERAPLAVMALAAVSLALVEYVFLAGNFSRLFPAAFRDYAPGIANGSWARAPAGTTAPWWGVLAPFAWWAGGLVLLWIIVPAAMARLLGMRVRDLGLSLRGVLPKLWVYAALYAVVLIAVWWASTRPGFTNMYPMLKPWYCQSWCWAVLLAWWGVYALQFFAVEFFFRGFMLFTLEKRFVTAAIAVMVVPYCMIHFHKPLPEALGAIVAGVVLGWMALRTRSIWGGWLLHVSVAITMDVASLMKGTWGLPHQFWP